MSRQTYSLEKVIASSLIGAIITPLMICGLNSVVHNTCSKTKEEVLECSQSDGPFEFTTLRRDPKTQVTSVSQGSYLPPFQYVRYTDDLDKRGNVGSDGFVDYVHGDITGLINPYTGDRVSTHNRELDRTDNLTSHERNILKTAQDIFDAVVENRFRRYGQEGLGQRMSRYSRRR